MADKVEITWHGHACFTLDFGKKVVIDPFIDGNPKAKIKKGDVKADLVVVTHGHSDHLGDAVEIARNNKAPIVTFVELGWMIGAENGDLDIRAINYSGSTEVNGITVTAVPALHSSSVDGKYAGNPAGMVISDGITVYHAGDTGVFGDMSIISDLYHPDISLLPIGGFYTMSTYEATYAAGLLKSPYIIPMHYNTFDLIKADAQKFKKETEEKHQVNVIVPEVEEVVKIDRQELGKR